MISIVATWRTEGIVFLFFFPIIVYYIYFYKNKQYKYNRRKVPVAILSIFFMIALFALPGWYGKEKYQDYDYFIINTPGHLATIYAADKVNVAYDEYDEDFRIVNSVIPFEYIKKYGGNASLNYNFDCNRLSRQCSVGNMGKAYCVSAYRFIFNNWSIFVKYQLNQYLSSIYLPEMFQVPKYSAEDYLPISEKAKYNYLHILNYYNIGKSILEREKCVWHNEIIKIIDSDFLLIGKRISGLIKVIVSIAIGLITLLNFLKRDWLFFFWGVMIMIVLAIVIFTAPIVRDNYFYYSYINQYLYLIFYYSIRVQKNKCPLQGI